MEARAAALLEYVPESLRRYLELTDKEDYQELRDDVLSYIRRKKSWSTMGKQEQGDMEVDAVHAWWKGKGGPSSPKGKGKGKSKDVPKGKGKWKSKDAGQSKGKEKGKGAPARATAGENKQGVDCWWCGKLGHYEKDCRGKARGQPRVQAVEATSP